MSNIGLTEAECREIADEMKSKKHQGLPVAGYAPQTDAKVQIVNMNKALEERVLRQLDEMRNMPEVDGRMLALGVTGVQQAFMWINRAVFQPGRVTLPEDSNSAE